MNKKILIFSLIGMILASCSKSGNNATAENLNNTAAIDKNNTIVIDVSAEPPTSDPVMVEDTQSARIAYDLFDGLVSFDQKNNIIPAMAKSWEISPNGKTYTFHLRDGLKFSNGTIITANDFVKSWQRLADPKTASPYNFLVDSIVNGKEIENGKLSPDKLGISAPQANLLIVNLSYPDRSFLQKCSEPDMAVVPVDLINKYGATWTDPQHIVTSGAYVLKEHVVNGYADASKNLNYWDQAKVKIQNIRYLPIVDTNSSFMQYQAGGLDITYWLPVDQYKSIKAKYPQEEHTVKQEAIYYYDFNMMNPELKNNLKLRQALSMAVDRSTLTRSVLGQDQTPLYSFVTPTVDQGKYAAINYDWANWPRAQQIKQAQLLYQEAGYSSEHPFSLNISYNTNDQHKKVALAIASMWHNVLGVNTTINNQEWKTFLQARHSGNFQVARDGWNADYDGIDNYTTLYSCTGPQNNSHYCNPKYDQLINAATLTADSAMQVKYNTQALKIAMADYIIIPLYQYTYFRVVSPRVKGYDPQNNHLDHVQTKWMSLN